MVTPESAEPVFHGDRALFGRPASRLLGRRAPAGTAKRAKNRPKHATPKRQNARDIQIFFTRVLMGI
jgi:hypothetical protein